MITTREQTASPAEIEDENIRESSSASEKQLKSFQKRASSKPPQTRTEREESISIRVARESFSDRRSMISERTDDDRRSSFANQNDEGYSARRLFDDLANFDKMNQMSREQIENRLYVLRELAKTEILSDANRKRSRNDTISENDDSVKRSQNIKLSNVRHLYRIKN